MTSSGEIFVVEDESKIADVLATYLRDAGYETQLIADGSTVVEAVRARAPALIILDLMLPGKDGLQVCREIRAFSEVPIIMLTARVDEIDRLLGLELGADDYICKPFSPREVVARVRANLRRWRASETGNELPGLVLDRDRFLATLDGQTLTLTPVEFRLLGALAESPGRVWRRDALLNRMYVDHRNVSDRTVDSHVTNLRRKLQAVRPGADALRSVYGVGYRLEL